MSFEIVDGMTGTKHISSDDLSALNIATIGESNCVLNYGDDFALTMASANSATLGTGVGMVGGKRFWNQAATSLTIQSGTQGQKRNDLIVARYQKTSAGIESITPVVIKGTPTTGTPADPEVTASDLKLWRVPLDGISVGEPVKLFEPVTPLATLGESVSQTAAKVPGHVYAGTKTIPSSGGEARLFTADEFESEFGREFSASTDYIGVMNSDGTANGGYLTTAYYSSASRNLWVKGGDDGLLRVNYLVFLAD